MKKSKLFVDLKIEIKAPAKKVWTAITGHEFANLWAIEFSRGGAKFQIQADWDLGSPVLWEGEDGQVIVEGNVTKVKPYKLLRFTVFDLRYERPRVKGDDGITFVLTERKDKTALHVSQGDFSTLKEGEKHRDLSEQAWRRALPKIKELAENFEFKVLG